ncbi:MAG: DUF3419 family protein [Parachlamydiaceae bacterium]|nr:DUF3419 family protein [Parachlamydiaceae bacterium]
MIDRSNRRFFSRLSYSFGNEDPDVERKALSIKPQDRALCITASGDRPLHLLLDDCAEVVSVDLNETQNHLLALKAKAMEHLDFEQYISFLGGAEDQQRLTKFQHFSSHLEEKERVFWTENSELIVKGILYQGAVEKICSRIASVLRVIRRKKVKRLFEIENIEEQREFVQNQWNSFFWRKSFDWLFNGPFMRLVLKDPGVFAHLGGKVSPGKYLFQRFSNSLNTTLASENPLLSLVLRGHVQPKAFPPYLTKEGVATIKLQLHKLTWQTENVITFLEKSPSAHFDCFSLSDIASYMDVSNFERLVSAIHRTAKHGARFSIRQFMSDHPFPASLEKYFVRNPSLEAALEAEEQCFVYRFMAGVITK